MPVAEGQKRFAMRHHIVEDELCFALQAILLIYAALFVNAHFMVENPLQSLASRMQVRMLACLLTW